MEQKPRGKLTGQKHRDLGCFFTLESLVGFHPACAGKFIKVPIQQQSFVSLPYLGKETKAVIFRAASVSSSSH